MNGTFCEYRGCVGSIDYSSEDKIHFGKLLNTDDLVNYEADSIESLYDEFHKAVNDYLDTQRRLD